VSPFATAWAFKNRRITMKRTIRAAIDQAEVRKQRDARLLEESFQHCENKHLAAFAAEVETAREVYRRWPELVTAPELRADLAAVLHLAEALGIEAEDVMTNPYWRERVHEETRELATNRATARACSPHAGTLGISRSGEPTP
jgi:hypothetical protein